VEGVVEEKVEEGQCVYSGEESSAHEKLSLLVPSAWKGAFLV
jgi:hypothetical protein